MDGGLSIDFGSFALTTSFTFSLGLSNTFRTLVYPEDGSGLLPGTPTLGPVADPLVATNIPPGATTGLFLDNPSPFHLSLVLIVDDNSVTAGNAPATITVDLVSVDSSAVELDRLPGILLSQLADDGDPDNITYTSDLDTAIVLVDGPVTKTDFPSIAILQIETGGDVFAVECLD